MIIHFHKYIRTRFKAEFAVAERHAARIMRERAELQRLERLKKQLEVKS